VTSSHPLKGGGLPLSQKEAYTGVSLFWGAWVRGPALRLDQGGVEGLGRRTTQRNILISLSEGGELMLLSAGVILLGW